MRCMRRSASADARWVRCRIACRKTSSSGATRVKRDMGQERLAQLLGEVGLDDGQTGGYGLHHADLFTHRHSPGMATTPDVRRRRRATGQALAGSLNETCASSITG